MSNSVNDPTAAAVVKVITEGPAGIGVPAGGNPGQVLGKRTAADHDTEWINQSALGSAALADITDVVLTSPADGQGLVYNAALGVWINGDVASAIGGATILSGTSNPTPEIGSDGDFYLNTTTTTLFGPKVSGAWPAGVPLIGPVGADGADGAPGADGSDGSPGASAYQVAVTNGFAGTEAQWLASLVGPAGADGASAYEIAVAAGFVGTESQWLASLVGPAGVDGVDGADGAGLALQGNVPTVGDLPSTSTVGYGYIVELTGDLWVWNGSTWVNAGPIQGPPGADGADGGPGADGASAYEVAVAAGFAGTEAQWLASLVGPAGADGGPGADGSSAYETAVAGGFVGTEAEWLASLVGPAGADGANAYQVAVAAGFVGTEAQWLASLVGPAGADGADGAPGADGADGAPGVGVPAGGTPGQALIKASGTDYDASWQTLTVSDVLVIACSDETSNLTAGTDKARFTMPYAGTLTAVKADVNTAPTGSTLVVDINEAGVSVLSTKLSIDAGETSSSTAATPAVISDTALANGAVIGIDIDQIGSTVAGAGLKVTLYVTRS